MTSTHPRPTTLSDTIYEYFKNSIIQGIFKPNQRLQEKEIAAFFRCSGISLPLPKKRSLGVTLPVASW